MNFYVHEKLRELEAAELKDRLYFEPSRLRPSRLGVAAALAGRILRRTGERLESWAEPPERERAPVVVRRAAR